MGMRWAMAWAMTLTLAAGGGAQAASLTSLLSFTNKTGADKGNDPQAGLIIDGAGNLYGTTLLGGTYGAGTVFELAKAGSSFTFSSLASFNNGTGSGDDPFGGLYMDASGNLYGTTADGGPATDGNVFKLAKNGSSYTLSTVAYFTGTGSGHNGSGPDGTLIADSSGDLFGTTNSGGTTGYGTAYELKAGALSTVVTLANFPSSGGGNIFAGLVADGSGNLFGTADGGYGNDGSVYELTKNGSSYTQSTLVSFTYGNGANPYAGLIMDSLGNLYGTTYDGGANNDGTVFELTKASGYALTTLTTFNNTNGKNPDGGLIEDANGDLFGTTDAGGTAGDGTVFELTNGGTGYTLSTLATFTGANGATPYDSLVADASGNLFGTTTAGGTGGFGTVFEVTNSGYAVAAAAVPEPPSWMLLAGAALATAAWRRRLPS